LKKISIGIYSNIRITSQTILKECLNKFSPKLILNILPDIIKIISNKESKENEITGSIYLMEGQLPKIISNFDLFNLFIFNIINISHITKNTIQERIFELFDYFIDSYYENNINKSQYEQIINNLLLFIKNNQNNLHWKIISLISTILVFMIKFEKYCLPINAIQFLINNLNSDIDKLRQISYYLK
jgi:hypothetical protein